MALLQLSLAYLLWAPTVECRRVVVVTHDLEDFTMSLKARINFLEYDVQVFGPGEFGTIQNGDFVVERSNGSLRAHVKGADGVQPRYLTERQDTADNATDIANWLDMCDTVGNESKETGEESEDTDTETGETDEEPGEDDTTELEYADLERKVRALEGDIRKLRARLTRAREKNEKLKKRVDSAISQASAIDEQLQQIDARLVALDSLLTSELELIADSLASIAAELLTQVDRLEEVVREQQRALFELQVHDLVVDQRIDELEATVEAQQARLRSKPRRLLSVAPSAAQLIGLSAMPTVWPTRFESLGVNLALTGTNTGLSGGGAVVVVPYRLWLSRRVDALVAQGKQAEAAGELRSREHAGYNPLRGFALSVGVGSSQTRVEQSLGYQTMIAVDFELPMVSLIRSDQSWSGVTTCDIRELEVPGTTLLDAQLKCDELRNRFGVQATLGGGMKLAAGANGLVLDKLRWWLLYPGFHIGPVTFSGWGEIGMSRVNANASSFNDRYDISGWGLALIEASLDRFRGGFSGGVSFERRVDALGFINSNSTPASGTVASHAQVALKHGWSAQIGATVLLPTQSNVGTDFRLFAGLSFGR